MGEPVATLSQPAVHASPGRQCLCNPSMSTGLSYRAHQLNVPSVRTCRPCVPVPVPAPCFVCADEMEQHVRSEMIGTGEPVSHGTSSMVIADNQLMGIQFQTAGIPANAEIGDVMLTLEMFGNEWLALDDTVQQVATLNVTIQAHSSAVSADLRYDENDISTRQLTETKVYWSIPRQADHAIIETPDIGDIFRELQNQAGWTELSSVTIVLSPVDPTDADEPGAYRTFKSLKSTNVRLT